VLKRELRIKELAREGGETEEGQQMGGLWFFKKPGSMTSESVREGLHRLI